MSDTPYKNPWLSFESRRGRINQIGENTARTAAAWATFKTVGWGEIFFPDCWEFDLTYAERPFVSYSNNVIDNKYMRDPTLAVLLPGPPYDVLIPTRFPRCFGGVFEWKRNAHGFYDGAWVYVVVETESMNVPSTWDEPMYTMLHHFTVNGLGIKDLPDYELDA